MSLYQVTTGIFSNALTDIQGEMFSAASNVINNHFFNAAFTLSIIYIGYMIAFQKFKTEEIAYKTIWLIIIFSIVKSIYARAEIYYLIMDFVNLPANFMIELAHTTVSSADKNASIGNLLTGLSSALDHTTSYITDKATFSNPAPYIYGILLYLSGGFLTIVILIFSVFSIFLAKFTLSLLPFVAIFLLWRKTESIFFNWLRLYISLSLYAPATILFGLLIKYVTEYTLKVVSGLEAGGFKDVVGVCLVLILISFALLKLPNLINQIIGSSNEGGTISGGVGTMSAGATAIGTAAKYGGFKFAGNKAASLSGKVAAKGLDAVKKSWFNNKN